MNNKLCIYCNSPLIGRNSTFCSIDCRRHHELTVRPIKQCPECNKETRNPKFCSQTCAAKSNNRTSPKRWFICKRCGSKLPRASRTSKFCINCKIQSGKKFKSAEQCICIKCNKEYTYIRTYGGTKQLCRSCSTNRNKDVIKLMALEYKGKKCSICEYDKCIQALSFHHLDPNQKDFNISGAHSRKWSTIQAELDKCILVCANCHAEIHYGIEGI